MSTVEKQMELYLLANGNQVAKFKDFTTVDLTGGTWTDDETYQTKNFEYYSLTVDKDGGYMGVRRNGDATYTLLSTTYIAGWGNPFGIWYRGCVTQETDIGRKVCKSLESSGWKYNDTQL